MKTEAATIYGGGSSLLHPSSQFHSLGADFAALDAAGDIGTFLGPLVIRAESLVLLVDDFEPVHTELAREPYDHDSGYRYYHNANNDIHFSSFFINII